MKLFQKIFPAVLGLLLLTGTAFAQGQQMQGATADSVSDKELTSFVKINKEVREAQQALNAEIQQIVKDEGMEMERFQKIMMSKQNPQAADVELTNEEKEIIAKVQQEGQQKTQELRQQQMSIIEDNGLTLPRFQQIAQAIRSNPAMMQKVQKMMTDSTSNEGGDN